VALVVPVTGALVLDGGDPGHVVDLLGAIEGRDPEPEIPDHMQAVLGQQIEDRRKSGAVAVDDRRISVGQGRAVKVPISNALVTGQILGFDVQSATTPPRDRDAG
jgi:hypothetical protein